ncbi:hypothetical protein H8S37_09820 [Mediterraneibacter sp. NSJ-55]|uniref:Uncharacterized protein n=1 Tax=Mediterraneibacter hominis TaxID=2763054 RepID=A0A923LJP9_9FIRM|nr:DUF5702 domain-containing protein [Mediterraneibacter hominis]MBC5689214.1 hypothetical protein [Mediterraneibacter hominis]
MLKGEVTAFLSLIFILLISFIMGVMEAAVIQEQKSKSRIDTDAAVYSVFGEYQKELFQEYQIFGMEGSYETGDFNEQNIIRRMHYYGTTGMQHEIEAIQLLTDNQGQAFREQVVTYMEQKTGISTVKEIADMTESWKEQEIEGEKVGEKEENVLSDYEELIPEGEEAPDLGEENPFACLEEINKSGILSMVLPEEFPLSGKNVDLDSQPSYRNRITGRGELPARQNLDGIEEKLLFSEYVLEKFQNAMSEEEKERSLSYETEYILSGKESDEKNLESVVQKIFLIRMGINYLYLLTDTVKQGEAAALALTVSTLLAIPWAEEAVKQLILIAWAAGESIMDLRSLLSGNRVALIKTTESWQLSLSGLMTLGSESDSLEGTDCEGGFSYEDYLRVLLFLKDNGEISMRSLDRIEQNLIYEQNLPFFRTDFCIVKIKLQNQAVVGGKFTYEFPVYFGYE